MARTCRVKPDYEPPAILSKAASIVLSMLWQLANKEVHDSWAGRFEWKKRTPLFSSIKIIVNDNVTARKYCNHTGLGNISE